MTVPEALAQAADELDAAGVETPLVDAEWLLAHVLGTSRSGLALVGEVAAADLARFRELVGRRAERDPLAYVLGEWGFRRLTLQVDPRVLVPRPETEVLVERCLALLAGAGEPRVLDVGVGSGAIALAIADEHPGARVVATDTSPDALAVAEANRTRLGVDGRLQLVHGDLLAGRAGPFDLVVSNPPYVRPEEWPELPPEVRREPRAALVGSDVGETIAAQATAVLAPGGWLVLETGDGQAPALAAALAALGYDAVAISRDLAGRERIVEGRRP
jgi:release factor glutamine methyltransferase